MEEQVWDRGTPAGRRKKKTGCRGVRQTPWPGEATGGSSSSGCSGEAVAVPLPHAGQGRDVPAAAWPATVPTAPYSPRAGLGCAHPKEIGAHTTQGHCGSGEPGQWGSTLPSPWGDGDSPCARAKGRH